MDLLAFFLCFSLLLLPPALGSPSSHYITATQKSAVIRISPDLPEMFMQVNESRLRSYVQIIQEFGPHPTGSSALDALGDYLFSEFTAMNISVKYDRGMKNKSLEKTSWQHYQEFVQLLQQFSSVHIMTALLFHQAQKMMAPGLPLL